MGVDQAQVTEACPIGGERGVWWGSPHTPWEEERVRGSVKPGTGPRAVTCARYVPLGRQLTFLVCNS